MKNSKNNLQTFPGSPFKLQKLFPPAGDQPEAISKILNGLDSGLQYQTLLGVTGSVKLLQWPMSLRNAEDLA